MSGRSKTALAAAIFVFAVAALIVYSTLALGARSCEVCIEFQGRTQCRSAKGSTTEEAVRTAAENACSFLASGVTGSIACANTPPKSVKCR
jgi:preprotein translocase subunit SecF